MWNLGRWFAQRKAANIRKKKARAWSFLETAVAGGTEVVFRGAVDGPFSIEYGGKGKPGGSYHLSKMAEITHLLRHERPYLAISERGLLEQGISIAEKAATLDLLEHEIGLGGAIQLCYQPDKQKFEAQASVVRGVGQVRRYSSTLRSALQQVIADAGHFTRR